MNTMKKSILCSLFLCLIVYCHAQDEYGYYNYSKKTKDGSFRFISTPSKFLTYDLCPDLGSPFLPMRMDYLLLLPINEVPQEQYTISFTMPCNKSYSIQDGGRLLIKHEDGSTLTLTVKEGCDSEYNDGKYYLSPVYNISKENIDSIAQKGVIKLRFETILKNIDVELKSERFLMFFNDFIKGIEERKNSNQDSFESNF